MATKAAIEITQLEADCIEDGKMPQMAAAISATTAGLMPVNAACTASKVLYFKKRRVRLKTIKSEGVTTPDVAATEPKTPAILYPTKVAALIAIGPGVTCEIAADR